MKARISRPVFLALPSDWDGCPHVVPCAECGAKGWLSGLPCPVCQKRRVLWNRVSLPETMVNAGYRVEGGQCFWRGVLMSEVSIIGGIWEMSRGPVCPPAVPVDLSLLDGVPVWWAGEPLITTSPLLCAICGTGSEVAPVVHFAGKTTGRRCDFFHDACLWADPFATPEERAADIERQGAAVAKVGGLV